MRLQHQLACAASLLTLSLAGAASAAATDWSGFYVGATAGGTFTNNRFELPGDVDDVLKSDHAGASSFTGGGLVGFNYQRDNLVAGVEGDYTFGNSSATVVACNVTDGCFTSAHDSFTTYNRLHEDGVGRVRVRFGVARGATLFYAAAGYSTSQTKLNLVGDCFDAGNPNVPLVFTYSRAKTVSGFNLGAGVEHKLTDHFVARAEYLHDDFGSQTYRGDGHEWNDRRISVNYDTVRAAISYKF